MDGGIQWAVEVECSKRLGFGAPVSRISACQSAAARRASVWAHELGITLQQLVYQHDKKWPILPHKHY